MSRYRAHLLQANSNLEFLEQVNLTNPRRYDWQTTVAFYSALHLVNAHLCDYGARYRSHHDVKDAINPVRARPSAVSHEAYTDYQKLFRLSRRARYLLDESSADQDRVAHTSEKHFAQAVRRLDRLLAYFERNLQDYSAKRFTVICDRLANGDPLEVLGSGKAS